MKPYLENNIVGTVTGGKLSDLRLQELVDYAKEVEAAGSLAGATPVELRADELIPLLRELVEARKALRHTIGVCAWARQEDATSRFVALQRFIELVLDPLSLYP